MNACSYPRRCCAFLLQECMPYYRKTRNTRVQTSSEMKKSSQSARSLLEFFGVNTHKRHKKSSTHMGTRSGTDVHNDTLANPHEIKVFGSRRIYFTEKI